MCVLRGSVSMPACRFIVAGAALCAAAFCNLVAGAAFGDVAKVLFSRIAVSGLCKHDTVSKAVAGAAFLSALKSGGSFPKSYFLSFWALL